MVLLKYLMIFSVIRSIWGDYNLALSTDAVMKPSQPKCISAASSVASSMINERPYDSWGTDGEGYDDIFKVIMPEGLLKHVKSRKRKGDNGHLLDLFGEGVFLKDMSSITASADSITGVRLKKRGTPHAPNHQVQEGDLYNSSTWETLEKSMRTRKIKSFDIIMVRPIGANFIDRESSSVSEILSFHKKYLGLIQKAYTTLTKRDGIIIFEVPPFCYGPEWVKPLRDHGFKVDLIEDITELVVITKGHESPANFPVIVDQSHLVLD